MPGINFHFNVNIYFYTNKRVTKNAVRVSDDQHFFPAGHKGVNPKKMARCFHLKHACNFIPTEETFNYFSLSTFFKCP